MNAPSLAQSRSVAVSFAAALFSIVLSSGCGKSTPKSNAPDDAALVQIVKDQMVKSTWTIRTKAGTPAFQQISQRFTGTALSFDHLEILGRSFTETTGRVRTSIHGRITGKYLESAGGRDDNDVAALPRGFQTEDDWTLTKFDTGWRITDADSMRSAEFASPP